MASMGVLFGEAGRFWRILVSGSRRKHFLKRLPSNTIGVEVGVFRGAFTRSILEIVHPRELHLIDGWGRLHGDGAPHGGRNIRFGRMKPGAAMAEVNKIIQRWDHKGACKMHVEEDVACLKTFKDGFFDWIYMDSAHDYDRTLATLKVVERKLRPGGMILGHDWRPDPDYVHHGVYKAVTEFCAKSGWKVTAVDDFTQWCISR